MSEDGSYSESSFTTLGLDYEQSQAHQPIRDEYEAGLTQEQLDKAALGRHRKRQRIGHSAPSSPVKQEEASSDEAPRSSVQEARHAFRNYYGPFGALNSQVGEGTYVDHLIDSRNAPESQSQTQESDFPGETQEPDEDHDSNHELEAQIQRLRSRLNIAMQERDQVQAECDQYRQAFEDADAERTHLHEQLRRWEAAATAASALTALLSPYH
ncbi:hypothetical protein C8R46DRAFT_1357075 [Mycena filopes]|nr:hypothetical protein C8R46DRAFT_1357075 [Mycena filopes]